MQPFLCILSLVRCDTFPSFWLAEIVQIALNIRGVSLPLLTEINFTNSTETPGIIFDFF